MELQHLPHSNPGFEASRDNLYQIDNNTYPQSTAVDVKVANGGTEKEAKDEKGAENEDPWSLPELTDFGTPWSELPTKGKIIRVISAVLKVAFLLGLLYLFICSLSFLSSAFRLLGGRTAGEVFSEDSVLSNPVAGVVIGLLATVLVQSSSTSTSIVVAMVGSDILSVKQAIPIIMGANIGTSVTNTIVSAGHAGDRDQFRRAFAGATVHDIFNWLSVVILLPLEVASGYLFHLSEEITDSLGLEGKQDTKVELLSKITKPFTDKIIKIDKKVITQIAENKMDVSNKSLIKDCSPKNGNGSNTCSFLFHDTGLSDTDVGIILLFIALFILCVCLALIVKLLHSMLKGQIAKVIKKVINSNFPGHFEFLAGYIAILVGAGLTILVQSSSIFTSALTPLVGIGVVTIERTYPLTLGANIGTTVTSILAALATEGDFKQSLQIALCHLFFNISGILIWYPVPLMRRVPIKGAKLLGDTTASYRWFAFMYLIVVFFLFPALVLGLSLAGWQVLVAVAVPVLFFLLCVLFINILQRKAPGTLPNLFKSWHWVPKWFRSLEPYDKVIKKGIRFLRAKLCCCRRNSFAVES